MKERKECIEMLKDLGSKDLTEEYHPNKKGKCYLSLEVAKGSYINFNFDYKEYEEVKVYSKKRNINEEIKISQVKQFLVDQGIIAPPQQFVIMAEEMCAWPIEDHVDWKVGEIVNIDGELPFNPVRWEVVYIQKNELDNITFYFLK